MFFLMIGAGVLFCLEKWYFNSDDSSVFDSPEEIKSADET
jgi:hypothetical protein